MKTYITVETSSGKHIYHFNYIVDDIVVGDEMIINGEICKVIKIENRQAQTQSGGEKSPLMRAQAVATPLKNLKANKAERGIYYVRFKNHEG